MAYIIADANAPQIAEVRSLKQNLITALNYSLNQQRQMDEMTDTQVTSQYGIPSAAVSAYRTTIDDVVATLQSASVTAIISQIGFSL